MIRTGDRKNFSFSKKSEGRRLSRYKKTGDRSQETEWAIGLKSSFPIVVKVVAGAD